MKFLCDSCKAKYQIADEKVAGKTVRMKCRKCGHLIEIRAGQALREPSAMLGLPAEELSQIYNEPGLTDGKSPSVPAPAAAPTPSPSVAAPRPAAGVSAAAAKKPVPTPAPRPAAGSPAGGGLRVAGSAAAAKAAPAAATATAAAPAADRAPRPAGGLASAFSKSVTADAKPTKEDSGVTRALDLSSSAASEEWYVGISGVPVGPVRLAELRSKAAAGQVTEDSLVWREGFEEWLPLRTFPDLLELVHSARGAGDLLSSGQKSGGSTPSNRPVSRSQQPAEKKGGAVISLRPGPEAAQAESERPAVAAAPEALSDPFAAPAPVVAPITTADPFAPPPGAVSAPVAPVASAAAMPVTTDEPAHRAPPPGRIPVAAWIAIVLALVTGVTAGSVLFSKPPPPPTVQIVTVTAPSPTAPVPSATAAATDTVAQADPTVIDPKNDAAGTPRKVGGPMPGGAQAAAPAKSAAPAAPALGLVGLPGAGAADAPSVGPVPGGGSTGAGPSAGEPLPSNKLQEVVNSNRNSLKRACWEPALNAKGGSGSSARVTVTFTVGRDGRVIRASASGADAYPTLGPCIAGRVKGWVFPSGYAETPTSFSLSFVAQGG